MPFYEYECSNCKFYTEIMQKISDAPLTKCPSCGRRKLKKLVSAPVFRLKGAGWYETDFKSDKEKKRNLAGADKEEAKPEATKTEGGEAKADAKATKADSGSAAASAAGESKPAKVAAESRGAGRARSLPAAKSAGRAGVSAKVRPSASRSKAKSGSGRKKGRR
ncbi:MAG TPA: zinc ribbon domain-containing protein [Steroidobacteraceae bacterium]|nr:zinc ribbon domain-containing protein [Steroidobacteraceae bacterium]